MHRKLWARLLSCVVALSLVFSSVPVRAYADGTGEQYGPIWNAPLGAYVNASDFLYAYMVKEGYAIVDRSGYEIRRWDSLSATDQIVLSNCTIFMSVVRQFVVQNVLVGNWQLISFAADWNLDEMQSELQQAYNDLHANDGPLAPGGAVGGHGGGGGGIPDDPTNPGPSDDHGFYPDSDGYSLYVSYVNRTSNKSFRIYDNKDSSSYTLVAWSAMPNVLNVHVKPGFRNWIVSQMSSAGSNIGIAIQDLGGSDFVNNVFDCILTSSSNTYVTKSTNDGSINVGINGTGKMYHLGGYNCKLAYSNGEIVCFVDRVPSGNFSWSNSVPMTFSNPTYYFGAVLGTELNPWPDDGGGTGGTVTPVPDPSTIEKPESPVSPTNPQTPERDSPTIVIGGTTQTVPDSSPAPDLSTIEELLRRILANTNTIIEQMNAFSDQLGQALADQYDMIYDWFSATNSWLDQLQAQMTRQLAWDNTFFDWLKAIDSDIQYLQSVCQNGFNDVVSWLQNIFNRLVQGNSGGSKPGIVDPEDPSPVMDWLKQLWTSFLADLQMVLPDQVGAVVDFLDQLRQKFPFSIPWDIAAMLALLNHAPVTPVIDIPWGYAGDVQMIHVDCHSWDGAVEIVRPMFLLLFALCLALLTRDLLAGLEAVL